MCNSWDPLQYKTPSHRSRNSHSEGETTVRPSCLYDGNSTMTVRRHLYIETTPAATGAWTKGPIFAVLTTFLIAISWMKMFVFWLKFPSEPCSKPVDNKSVLFRVTAWLPTTDEPLLGLILTNMSNALWRQCATMSIQYHIHIQTCDSLSSLAGTTLFIMSNMTL